MADPNSLPPLPADHLDHPEQWATGSEPATEKQKGFIAVLEKQHPELVEDGDGIEKGELGKSEASEIIDSLKKGEKPKTHQDPSAPDTNTEKAIDENVNGVNDKEGEVKEDKVGEKRKAPSGSTENEDNQKIEKVAEKEKEKEIPATQHSQVDELASSQDQDEVIEVDADGKDLKESKQTTLDGAFDNGQKRNGAENGMEEGKDEDRASKKAKLDESSNSTGTSTKEKVPTTIDPTPTSASENNGTKDVQTSTSTSTSTATAPSKNDSESIPNPPGETVPGSAGHLDHPENWTTGTEPATEKQKGFIKVLEKQKGVVEGGDVEHLGKSEASEKIEELKEL
ncbi:uncharacterized protein I303_100131 [Kwoniella dejecticola CBS 10117]|uniref:Uncharacterized protein n=1 Tax=Kwoniella dejecticola CBS 10117 TaxID=1296121 RepID=A0A1A6AE28_9TREE|nr:uncharacterized protein I303_00131 [Kwoniella dejecticola CBS 10117]OBR88320.1 hypothetical protein I303_00131 [Kwoniella dejecticola CBS 10117]